MKFVHMADMHFDIAFSGLESKSGLGNQRRLEQREIFKQMVEYIKQNDIEYLFISGDLYENEYIKQSTIEYINKQFEQIPKTKIFISPGNHDPYLKNSYYAIYKWADNVHIFSGEIEKIENEEVNIYGVGFTDFYEKDLKINEIDNLDKTKINILVIHGTLDGSDKQEMLYNPISKKLLTEKGFDYVALGHIHKTNIEEKESRIIYPGSTISLGFDELGDHGVIVGEITKQIYNIQFLKLDNRKFIEKEVDISLLCAQEELIEELNNIPFLANEEIKIILTGKRKFEINTNEINKLIQNEQIIKIKDETKTNYDIESIKKENSLKGIFVKNCLEKLESGDYNKEEIEKAIEIGLEAFGR